MQNKRENGREIERETGIHYRGTERKIEIDI